MQLFLFLPFGGRRILTMGKKLDPQKLKKRKELGARIDKIIWQVYKGRNREFAAAIGASDGNVGNWVRGVNGPGREAWERIIEKTGVNPTWLRDGEGPMFTNATAYNEDLRQEAPEIPIEAAKQAQGIPEHIIPLYERVAVLGQQVADIRGDLTGLQTEMRTAVKELMDAVKACTPKAQEMPRDSPKIPRVVGRAHRTH
jgi:hypothetical protein